MQAIKKYIPVPLKRQIKIQLCYCKDLFTGDLRKMAGTYGDAGDLYCIKSIEQPVKLTETSIFKMHNIGLAIAKLNNIIIAPGQIFSFWHLVGNPSEKNDYKKSRAIIGNGLQEEVGGGLCQLSGLVYFLALHAGLTITERHSHSLDIYKEEERFTPLGSDATVVYGYKDLRFINPWPFPISISFQLTSQTLTGMLFAAEKKDSLVIEFEYDKDTTHTHVTTISKQHEKTTVLDRSTYLLHTA